MSLLNWIMGIFIIVWTPFGLIYNINPYLWYAITFVAILIWLILTILGWKKTSDNRGDSWEGITTLIKDKLNLKWQLMDKKELKIMVNRICPIMSRPIGKFHDHESTGEVISKYFLEVTCLGKECAATYKKEYEDKIEWICTQIDLIVETEEKT